MKRLLFALPFLLILVFASCKSKPSKPVPVVTRDTTIQVCDFDIKPTEFNIAERELPPEMKAGRGGKPPKVTDPPKPVGSKGVIYLDFDGQTVTGTNWNFTGISDVITCAESGLTVFEQQQITDRVALDYKSFNITVTTDSLVYKSAPVTKRMRVIVTKSYEWFGRSGGVGFVGSFNWGNNTPCFVFSLLLNYNLKFISDATSHEAGHTLGLYHQSECDGAGNKLTEYKNGVLMGYCYQTPAPLWHNGKKGICIL